MLYKNKKLSYLIVLLSIICLTESGSPKCKAWKKFLETYNKTYSKPSEYIYRRKIFSANVQKIDAHNRSYKRRGFGYNCSINRYADLTTEEFTEMFTGFSPNITLGEVMKPKFKSLAKAKALTATVDKKKITTQPIPAIVDWRDEAVTAVKRQLKCGACWAFSAAGALEGQYYMKTKKLLSFSPQILVDCVKTDDTDGCEGGLMTDAFSWVQKNGIMKDIDYPYDATDGACRYNGKKKVSSCLGYVELPSGSEWALKKAVATVGPIAVGIQASFLSIQFYSEGIYFEPKCDPQMINHGVLVVGYGTENGKDYWIIKNSWGQSWGEDGYLRLARNRANNCGVATLASYPIV